MWVERVEDKVWEHVDEGNGVDGRTKPTKKKRELALRSRKDTQAKRRCC
jgi:hypothetical protein